MEEYGEGILKDGKVEYLEGVLIDITERKQAEKAQKEAQKKIEKAEKAQKKAEQSEKAEEKAAKKTSSPRKTDSAMDRFTKNVMSAVGREAGRILMRGITGMLTGKK